MTTVVAVVIVVFVVLMLLVGIQLWTDAIWFKSVGFDAVFWTRIGVQGGFRDPRRRVTPSWIAGQARNDRSLTQCRSASHPGS